MAIEFDIYPTPSASGGGEKTTYHARVANSVTIDTSEIAQNIHKRCTLTMSDIKAVLHELHDELVYHLCTVSYTHLTLPTMAVV